MTAVTLEEATSRLPELVCSLSPGEVVVITDHDQPVAELTTPKPPQNPTRQLGTMKGSVLYMAEDFDAPLEDFEEYMG
ncbi:MAG: type II toxin-antitoxin system Phd/YefM family antitoxin [Planctomycetaceae bacterium]